MSEEKQIDESGHTTSSESAPEETIQPPDAEGQAPSAESSTSEQRAEESESAAALKDQLLRLAADFDNFRKRTRRELEDTQKYGNERLLLDILPVLDNLQRALAHSSDDQSPIAQGVRMVAKQLVDSLARYGVKPVDAIGKPFDPEHHEALSQAPSGDVEPGVVLEEIQKGYLLHDRLLRPAQVVVSAPTEGT